MDTFFNFMSRIGLSFAAGTFVFVIFSMVINLTVGSILGIITAVVMFIFANTIWESKPSEYQYRD